MISTFHVQNYKALRDVSLDLTPIHLLIGPNDSGKTSILEAIAALCRSVDDVLFAAFRGRWQGRELVWKDAQNPIIEFNLTAQDGDSSIEYKTALQFPNSGREIRSISETITSSAIPETIIVGKGPSHQTVVGLRSAQSYNSGVHDEDLAAKPVHDLLSGVHLYRWVPAFLSLPNAPDASRRFQMEPTGFGLALCLDDIIGYDRRVFDQLEARFKSIFTDVDVIRLLPEPAFRSPRDAENNVPQIQNADGKGLHFQLTGGTTIRAAQASDGMLLILAYLAILHLPQPPRVLLIEEPENGIHPARLNDVLSILRDLIHSQSHTQVVMTTHSPYVLDLFQPKEVTLCFKGKDGAVQTRRLSESKTVREQIDVFTLGEIWTGSGDERLMEPADLEAVGTEHGAAE